jgi:hypothetical protein
MNRWNDTGQNLKEVNEMSKKQAESLEALQDKFDYFLIGMPDALEALEAYMVGLSRPELLPLDYSLESLDRVEKLYGLVLDGAITSPFNNDTLTTQLGSYIGETLLKQVGGKWSFCTKSTDVNYGMPCLTQIPGLPKSYCFFPLVVVAGYRNNRRPGWFRKSVEEKDIERLRKRFALFLAEMDQKLADLKRYVESLGRPELLPLDYSLESIDRLERVLSLALDQKIELPAGGVDWLAEQVARYMGNVRLREAGGEWSLCEDPQDINFALPEIGPFCPAITVKNYRLRRISGLLRRVTAKAIDAQK